MKIGEFAKVHKVTIDTIRHYIQLELVIPKKIKTQYNFDNACSQDMDDVTILKTAGFTLSEIQQVFVLKRLTVLNTDEDKLLYKDLLIQKKRILEQELAEKQRSINYVNVLLEKINILNETKNKKLGVPLGYISVIACPYCGSSLNLKTGEIFDSMIIEGQLECVCNFACEISNGIIIMPDITKDCQERKLTVTTLDYIQNTANEFINFMYKGINWMKNRITQLNFKNYIILEPGTGSGIFLTHASAYINKENCYVAVDKDLSVLSDTKLSLERRGPQGNYMFICSDFSNIPIKDNSIDLIVDCLGTTNYNFHQKGSLVNLLGKKLKTHGNWLASHFFFDIGAKSLKKYKLELRESFYIENIKSYIKSGELKIKEEDYLGFAQKAGIYEPFLIEGDKVFQWVCLAEKMK